MDQKNYLFNSEDRKYEEQKIIRNGMERDLRISELFIRERIFEPRTSRDNYIIGLYYESRLDLPNAIKYWEVAFKTGYTNAIINIVDYYCTLGSFCTSKSPVCNAIIMGQLKCQNLFEYAINSNRDIVPHLTYFYTKFDKIIPPDYIGDVQIESLFKFAVEHNLSGAECALAQFYSLRGYCKKLEGKLEKFLSICDIDTISQMGYCFNSCAHLRSAEECYIRTIQYGQYDNAEILFSIYGKMDYDELKSSQFLKSLCIPDIDKYITPIMKLLRECIECKK